MNDVKEIKENLETMTNDIREDINILCHLTNYLDSVYEDINETNKVKLYSEACEKLKVFNGRLKMFQII